MAYNYVVTAQKPTSVSHSVTGHFTSATDMNLILAKSSRLEIHLLTPDGLKPLQDVNLYGSISILKVFRPPSEEKDLLFICTTGCQFCVLGYDSDMDEIVTRTHGDLNDSMGRSHDVVTIGSIDPECRLIGMHLYEGYFKGIPIDNEGNFGEAFNHRLDELEVIDIKFLHGYNRPTICVLYMDFREARHISTYYVNPNNKSITEGPWKQSNLEDGASVLIPVPPPLNGVLIVGQQTVVYHNGLSYQATPMQSALVKVYGSVDKDGSRYLLGDESGRLLVVALVKNNGDSVSAIHLEVLGETSIASSLSYLDNGVVFVGSMYGDSQLLKLNSERDKDGSYIEILDTYMNIGPIVDFCVMDLERQGQGQIVTCSGAYKDGSLRIVRSGIGINEQANVELPGIKGMWSLRDEFGGIHDKYLLQSFIDETRILAMKGEEMEETEIPGFQNAKTLTCQNMVDDNWLQVTETEVRLISSKTLNLLDSWKPADNKRVTVAAANSTQLLVSTGGGNLVYFEVEKEKILQKTRTKLENEIACLDISPLEVVTDDSGKPICPLKTSIGAVGLWNDYTICILNLPELKVLNSEFLDGEVIPRSVLFNTFEQKDYILVGLGDGHLITFRVDKNTGLCSEKKKVSLGTQPIGLFTFHSKDSSNVFASSDRPTIIYSANGKLMYSNVNTKSVSLMCPFSTEAFPECLALASEENLTIGNVDDIQKLHIQTVPLNEWVRRICNEPTSRTIGVGASLSIEDDVGEVLETQVFQLFDDQTFELLDSFKMQSFECVCCISCCQFTDDSTNYYVVGTALTHEEEAEPRKGRILIFAISGHGSERKLSLVTEKETKGAVYCMEPFHGKLLAGINSKTQLFKISETEEGERELVSECGHHGHVLVLYLKARGDFIVVGDLMKSISLLSYKALDGSIDEIARDLNSNWMMGIDILDDNIFLGAEQTGNLFIVKRNTDAASDEERGRLEAAGEFHLGDTINQIRKGSLVMQPADSEISKQTLGKSSLFGTVHGMIGAILPLCEKQYNFFSRMEQAINHIVKGVGGFSHSEWRSFDNTRKKSPARNFIDGDLIERFLYFNDETMKQIINYLNEELKMINTSTDQMADEEDLTLENVIRKIEDMALLH